MLPFSPERDREVPMPQEGILDLRMIANALVEHRRCASSARFREIVAKEETAPRP
jgi:hypothetical protein